MKATILPNEISVVHSVRPEVNREYLTVNVPAGWDDVKKIAKKVLTYDGRKFTFMGWDSDTLQCFTSPYFLCAACLIPYFISSIVRCG